MATILITGANKGLGREAARRLVADGHDVWAAARDLERGRVAAAEVGARPLVLDVTDDASVDAATEAVAETTGGLLDVLINNAGVPGGDIAACEVTAAHCLAVYEVNVLGVVRVLHAFLPLLERSAAPVVVNVSSGLGSVTDAANPQSPFSRLIIPTYRSSKAALNMLTIQYAKAFPMIRINSVSPGFTATDFTDNRGKTVERGADIIVRMATIGPTARPARFSTRRAWFRGESHAHCTSWSPRAWAAGSSVRWLSSKRGWRWSAIEAERSRSMRCSPCAGSRGGPLNRDGSKRFTRLIGALPRCQRDARRRG